MVITFGRMTARGRRARPTSSLLCRRHHRCKQAEGWRLRLEDDGRVAVWITPAGHTYRVLPWDHAPPD
jgi:hypothetical protein